MFSYPVIVFFINPYKHNVFLWDSRNSIDPDQMLHNAESDQVLHCLLTESPQKLEMKLQNAGPFDLRRVLGICHT